jgi:hypothetical protein
MWKQVKKPSRDVKNEREKAVQAKGQATELLAKTIAIEHLEEFTERSRHWRHSEIIRYLG